MSSPIPKIEQYARSMMVSEIAHDFKHADRVRYWALRIAENEDYPHKDRVEAAALLHDIGLINGRAGHGETGAKMANTFLIENNLFSEDAVDEIVTAIRLHTSFNDAGFLPSNLLATILRDADIIDLLGPVGIMRAFTSMAHKPEYPAGNVKSDSWGITADQITERFSAGLDVGDYIVDQINFQISCYQNLKTLTAQTLARPLVSFMKNFMIELEKQIPY